MFDSKFFGALGGLWNSIFIFCNLLLYGYTRSNLYLELADELIDIEDHTTDSKKTK